MQYVDHFAVRLAILFEQRGDDFLAGGGVSDGQCAGRVFILRVDDEQCRVGSGGGAGGYAKEVAEGFRRHGRGKACGRGDCGFNEGPEDLIGQRRDDYIVRL